MKSYQVIGGTLVFGLTLLAAGPVSAAVSGTMNSTTDVTFTTDVTVTTPLNPLDPTTPVTAVNPSDPNDPHAAGTSGPLSIDYVSNFHFGSKVITSANATYYAQADKVLQNAATVDVPNFIQVTDKRGTNVGWKLSVKQNGQLKTTDGNNTPLTNAVLSFVAGTARSVTDVAYAPATQAVSLDPTGTDSSTVATATSGKGMGTWAIGFGGTLTEGRSAVSLYVPMSTAKVTGTTYRTSLTWNLEDTPN
ncbi:WxL domain-containing protein [Listeria costaricensis]|uniref:WxL domain-containing protein n=1 Tax=Listeria costaricensis TaxID=2026604 RepID=UPI001968ED83|nr:WxL domain-containing protein [Listeria costaricensis]